MTSGLPADLGDGLILCPTVASDAEDAYAVVDAERDRLREWLPWVDDTTNVVNEREFLAFLEDANAAGSGLHATIRLDGKFAGVVGLRINEAHRSAEVGYWLAAYAVGRGLMTRAVAAMIDIAVYDRGLNRVELMAATDNPRSRAVAERLGMVLEGVRREAELLASGFVDLAVYSMLAAEWPGAAAVLPAARPRAGNPANH
jgi:ribosomal-protein-serine acetyltransferase